MRLANRAFLFTLLILTLIVSVSAQTLRSDRDPRNTAPTVGTGGPPGGPTGLFTVYDGQTLRRGEYTFSAAYSNFDRDPGDADIVEVPISFQVGVNDYIELFFNTDAYRAVKINSPRNLSSFYLPSSQLLIGNTFTSGPAIILATGTPAGLGTGGIFRPQGTQPFVPFPYIGGSAGLFGAIGNPGGGGNGAANFPGLGSPCGSILPGVVLQTTAITNAAGAVIGTAPSVGSVCPSYLPDAPFISRTYAESSFNTFTVGGKIRFTGPNNPVGIGVIPFYRFYADKADDFDGFNQLTRGASPGGNIGDFGAVLFADARLRKWVNVSANVGYIYNSDVESNDVTILDRPDELLAALAVDFPVNKYFQPILEFRSLQYVGGRTPNAFQNNPLDGLAGVRIFPARWVGFGFAYRYHFNQQNDDSFDDEDFTGTVNIAGQAAPVNFTFTGVPPGFRTSTDAHGFIIQGFIGRRNARQAEIINQPANVTGVTLGESTVYLPCPPGQRSRSGQCSDDMNVTVATTAVDPENDVLTYSYTVSGGRIVGTGANVTWDLSGARAGTYTITAGVDDGCGICGQTQTQTVTIAECNDCEVICECPDSINITAPPTVNPGERMTFTANVVGGTQQTLTYNWSVDQGTIVEGQGTPSITVDTTGLSNTTVRATVDIGGLCETCPRTASETGVVAGVDVVTSVQIDEFGRLSNDDVRARIDNLFIELQNDPGSTGYIINYGPARQVTQRERLIRNHIQLRGYDASRVVIINGGVEPEIRTTLWRVPQGATPPTP